MRYLIPATLIAFLAAVLITVQSPPQPLDTRLVQLQVEQALPQYAPALTPEPPELQSLFLIYADDELLLAKARSAMLRYPEIARPILLTYGDDPAFQDVLRRYGEDIVLPVHYFMANEVLTLKWMRSLGQSARSAVNSLQGLWPGAEPDPAPAVPREPLSSEERGRYAVHFIQEEGYDFLGQFVISDAGQVGWVQTERLLEGINRLMAGGLRGLETKFRRDEAIGAGDVGWAAMDVAIGVGAFKLLRMGRTASAGGRALTVSQRSTVVGAGLWRTSAIGVRLVKYGAPAVLAYMAVRHPSVINSLLASAAERLGVPVPVAQVVGWTLVLLPVVLVLRLLLGPLVWALGGVLQALRWADRAWGRRVRYRRG